MVDTSDIVPDEVTMMNNMLFKNDLVMRGSKKFYRLSPTKEKAIHRIFSDYIVLENGVIVKKSNNERFQNIDEYNAKNFLT